MNCAKTGKMYLEFIVECTKSPLDILFKMLLVYYFPKNQNQIVRWVIVSLVSIKMINVRRSNGHIFVAPPAILVFCLKYFAYVVLCSE